MQKEKIALVWLYGCNIESPLKMHLDNVVRVGTEEGIRHYVLCGGPSQKENFPGLTEAEVAVRYLRGKVPPNSCFWREERSLNSYGNAKWGTAVIHQLPFEVLEVVVFVEALRALKAAILLRHFLPEFHPSNPNKRIRFETASWEQMHPVKELIATTYDLLSIYIPPLAWYWYWKRTLRSKDI